jgi:hypothetical protein
VQKGKKRRNVKSNKRNRKRYEIVYVKKGAKPLEQKSIHLNSCAINERNPYVNSQLPKGAFLEKIVAAEDFKKKAEDEKDVE